MISLPSGVVAAQQFRMFSGLSGKAFIGHLIPCISGLTALAEKPVP